MAVRGGAGDHVAHAGAAGGRAKTISVEGQNDGAFPVGWRYGLGAADSRSREGHAKEELAEFGGATAPSRSRLSKIQVPSARVSKRSPRVLQVPLKVCPTSAAHLGWGML